MKICNEKAQFLVIIIINKIFECNIYHHRIIYIKPSTPILGQIVVIRQWQMHLLTNLVIYYLTSIINAFKNIKFSIQSRYNNKKYTEKHPFRVVLERYIHSHTNCATYRLTSIINASENTKYTENRYNNLQLDLTLF